MRNSEPTFIGYINESYWKLSKILADKNGICKSIWEMKYSR